MANHKATKKDTRQANKRRERNRYHAKTTRNAMRDLLATTDQAQATEMLPKVVAMLDKLAKRNIIHKNKASNLKSSLTIKVSNITKTVSAEATKKPKKTATKTASKKASTKKAKTASAE